MLRDCCLHASPAHLVACRSRPITRSLRHYPAHSCSRTYRLLGLLRCHAAAADLQQQQAATSPEAQALKRWVLQHTPHPPVDLTPTRSAASGGYGMVTSQAVEEGEVLLSVPLQLFMTQETARGSPLCGQLVTAAGLEEWQALLLQLLCERAAGGDSFWAPYLAVLGEQGDHPLLWPPGQVSWLAGSPMAGRLAARSQQCEEDAEALIAAGANQLPVALSWRQATGTPLVTPRAVCWAAAVLLSRAFCLDLAEPDGSLEGDLSYWGSWGGHGPNTLALVPWADMLAHSSEADEDSVLCYVPEEGAAQLSAHQGYSPGQEVYDSYGPGLSPSDLLLDYGFVDPANNNHRYDADPSAVLPPRGPRQAALLAALAPLQGESPTLALGVAGPDTTALTYLRAAATPDADLVRAGWRLKAGPGDTELACRVMGQLATPGGAATEGVVLAALEAALVAAAGAYPTTLQQDMEEMEALTAAAAAAAAGGGTRPAVGTGTSEAAAAAGQEADNSSSSSSSERWRRLQVLRALVSEKRALAGSLEVVGRWRGRLAAGVPLGEVYEGVAGGPEEEAYA